jgi:Ser/Thr protein kinase RdoA (MazF antagonist)
MAGGNDFQRYLTELIADHYDIGRPVEVRTLQDTRNHTLEVRTDSARYALRIRGDAWWIGDE